MTSKLYFVRIAKIVIITFSLEILDPFKVNVNIFDMGLYADNKLLKKKVRKLPRVCRQKFILFSPPLTYHVILVRARVLSISSSREQCEKALFLLTFISYVDKRRCLKIFSSQTDEIWHKSCSFCTSVNESFKMKVEQKRFVTQSSFS